jgi:hypothetical protein
MSIKFNSLENWFSLINEKRDQLISIIEFDEYGKLRIIFTFDSNISRKFRKEKMPLLKKSEQCLDTD